MAEHMCHSVATARRFYDTTQRQQKSRGYVVSTDTIYVFIHGVETAAVATTASTCRAAAQAGQHGGSAAGLLHQWFTEGEEELITMHFAEDITTDR